MHVNRRDARRGQQPSKKYLEFFEHDNPSPVSSTSRSRKEDTGREKETGRESDADEDDELGEEEEEEDDEDSDDDEAVLLTKKQPRTASTGKSSSKYVRSDPRSIVDVPLS